MQSIKKIILFLLIGFVVYPFNLVYANSNNYLTLSFDERLKLAEQGDSTAQFNVGLLYTLGLWSPYIESDDETGKKWLEQSATQLNTDAIIFLCNLVNETAPQTKTLIAQAKQGDQQAMITLAQLVDSNCLTQDEESLVKSWYSNIVNYYQQKADNGDDNALMQLAFIYHNGTYVKQDRDKSKQIFNTLAKKNNPIAMMAASRYLDDSEDEYQQHKKIFNLLQTKVKNSEATPEELALLGVFYSGRADIVQKDESKTQLLLLQSLISTTQILDQNRNELSFEWRIMALRQFSPEPNTPEYNKLYQQLTACQNKMTSACY